MSNHAPRRATDHENVGRALCACLPFAYREADAASPRHVLGQAQSACTTMALRAADGAGHNGFSRESRRCTQECVLHVFSTSCDAFSKDG